MPKINNKTIYNQDENLSMEDYLLGTNNNTVNKKTQTYSLGSIFSLFYNFLGFNAFLFTTDTITYPIGTPGCMFVLDENDDLTNDFTESTKITFSATDTYNFNVADYFGIVVNSGKFLFKLINLEDKNNFVFLKPSNFVLGGTGTTFNVDVLAESGLSNGGFVNYKRYLLVLEFASGTFSPSDYDLSDFTNTSVNPFATVEDITDALALLPDPITKTSELINDGENGNPFVDTNDLLSKLNKVSTVDVEKVYIKNADGTQGVKPTSEIGISALTEATDFPSTYVEQAGKAVVVNEDEDAVEFVELVKDIVTNASVSGTFNLDADLTDTYVLTLTGNTALALVNFSSTKAQQMTIYITGNFALTYPVGAKVLGAYSTTKTNQLVLEKVGSSIFISINGYV